MKRFFLFLFLGACAPCAPVLKPTEVLVPVSAPCKAAVVEKPDFAMGHIGRGDSLAEKTRAALIEINQRRAYEVQLESQIAACR